MTYDYASRLLWLCLACFFLTHLVFFLVTWMISSWVIDSAMRMDARRAARLMLALRLAPLVGSLAMVGAVFAPSYLWLEPRDTQENVGTLCRVLAIACAVIWVVPLTRATRACVESFRFHRFYASAASIELIEGERISVIESNTPLAMVSGVVRPKVIFSRSLINMLRREELAAVLEHERAHSISRDNLKRLITLLAPDIVPGLRGLSRIEREWAGFTERVADDAAATDSFSAAALASALVQIARMRCALPAPSLARALVDEAGHVAGRVQRLLNRSSNETHPLRRESKLIVALPCLCVVLAVVWSQEALSVAHKLLEHLIR